MKTFDEEVKEIARCDGFVYSDHHGYYECILAGIKSLIRARLDSCPQRCLPHNIGEDSQAQVIKLSDAYRAFGIEGKEK